jgi:hypothetical protein
VVTCRRAASSFCSRSSRHGIGFIDGPDRPTCSSDPLDIGGDSRTVVRLRQRNLDKGMPIAASLQNVSIVPHEVSSRLLTGGAASPHKDVGQKINGPSIRGSSILMLHPIRGAGLTVEKSPSTNTFVLTRLIGGKLRALYNEEPQPCSSRMAELLETLASANRKLLAETRPPEDASGLSAAPGSR